MDFRARKHCQALDIMLQADHAKGEESALRVLEQAPIDSRYRVVWNLNYSVRPAGFTTRVRDLVPETPFGALTWDSLRTSRDRADMARPRNRPPSPHLRMFLAAVLNLPDRNHVADFLRRELTEAGASEVASHLEELASEGIVRWNDDGKLPEIVCNHLLEQSEGARRQLGESNDLFLRIVAR